MAGAGHETAPSVDELLRQSPSIPTGRTVEVACCCGRPSCAYLTHNNAALDDLERDVRTAAQLGQALLVRHETYMAEAESARKEMSLKIESLEKDKKNLEAENARTIQENRGLLDQLEHLNNTVADSEAHVKSLEATLESTQKELRRMEGLASRTRDLETQLSNIEQEHSVLQQTVTVSAAEERTAIQRWRKAERALSHMTEQLEKMEREALQERERHVEAIGRMERQRAVETELQTAAGRLKGAAAATSIGQGKSANPVVSHFVKDILQDNVNLQMGIVELREMLATSNEEVQKLREQLVLHQPLRDDDDEDEDDDDTTTGPPTLRAESAPKESHVVSQELHIHHHYHVTPRRDDSRRSKRKRNLINPSLFTPPHNSHSRAQSRSSPSTAAAILSHTSMAGPSPKAIDNNRWSVHSMQTISDFASSSAPSSPQSNFRNSNLFDRGFIDGILDSSRPTSPGSSIEATSPIFQPYHRKHGSEHSVRSFSAATPFQAGNTIHEEDDHDISDLPDLSSGTGDATSNDEPLQSLTGLDADVSIADQDMYSPFDFRPSLRRAASHESILSIAGLDIHTLKSRPSQLTITAAGAMLRPGSRHGVSSPITSLTSTTPVISSSVALARPTLSRKGHDSTSYLRSSMGIAERPPSRASGSTSSTEGLTKKVGGWVWGRWGVSPASSPSSLAKKAAAIPLQRAVSTPVTESPKPTTGRPPGINQKGPIIGLRKPDRAPSQVKPDRVDQDALREILQE